MEVRQLYYVLEVAKQGNYSKAAKTLYVTQSNISQQIRALEEEINISLFYRDTHNVELTPEGKKFCELSESVIKELDKINLEFKNEKKQEVTHLNISGFDFFERTGHANMIMDFYKNNQNLIGGIRMLDAYEAYDALDRNVVDFSIIKLFGDETLPERFEFIKLSEEAMNVIVSDKNPLAKQDLIDVYELDNLPFVTGNINSFLYYATKRLFNEYKINFNPSFLAESPSFIENYIIDFDAATLGSTSTCDALTEKGIVSIPLNPPTSLSLYLVYKKERKLTRVDKNLINHITNEFTRLVH